MRGPSATRESARRAACGVSSQTVATIAAATAAPSTALAAAATTAATGAGLTFLCNADAERTTFEVRTVELGNGFLSVCIAAHRDECEAARTARLAVNHQLGFGDFTSLAERAQEHVFGGVKGKVAHVQSVVHYLLLSTVVPPCGGVATGADVIGSGVGVNPPRHTVVAGKRLSATLVPDERAARRLPNTLCGRACSADH